MGLTGKYDFSGIQKWGAIGIETLISTSSAFGAALMKFPVVGTLIDGIIKLFVNYLANQGLVLINIGAIIVNGNFDQEAFDSAMDKAIASAKVEGLTDAQKKAIDDSVIKAFRKFADLGATVNQ